MQKYKDSQQLDAMYKMAGMGGDEEDDEPNRKKRELSEQPLEWPYQRLVQGNIRA